MLERVLVGELAELREPGSARIGLLGEWRHRHQPGDGDGRARDELAELLGRDAGLAVLAGDVDLDEDAQVGRLYLPREALDTANIVGADPATVLASPRLGQACGTLVTRAREHFEEADLIMARSPRRAVKAPRIMGRVYRVMLEGMVARGWDAPRQRVRVTRARIAWIVLRHAII